MNFLSNFFPPKVVVKKVIQRQSASSQPIIAGSGTTQFEALRISQDRTPIFAPMLGTPTANGFARVKLAALASYVVGNFGLAGYAVNTIANYAGPVIPQADSPNPEWNDKADEIFAACMERADYTGRFDFCDLQRIVSIAVDVHGDIGELVTDENGIPQIVLIEGWRIGSPIQNKPGLVDGVYLDAKGRVTGYDVSQGGGSFQQYSTGQMRLLYDPEFYSGYRGTTPLRKGLNDIRDAEDIKRFKKLSEKIYSSLPAYIKGAASLEEDVWGNNTGTDGDAPAADATKIEKATSLFDFLGGDIPTLPDGQEIVPLVTNGASSNTDLLTTLAGHYVTALDIPPAFLLDEKLTGPNLRSVNGKAQRKFNTRSALNAKFAKFYYLRCIAWHIDKGLLEPQVGSDKVAYRTPAKFSIDLGEDRNQARDDVAAGLMSRRNHYNDRALSWDRETDQIFTEDDYIIDKCKEQSARTGVKLDILLARHGFTPKEAQPKQQPAQNANATS